MSKADKTRQFIVEKTACIFNKKGFAGTSLNDLMLATGLTKGSIYGNFANKDEVALAVFEYNCSLLTGGVNAACATSGNAVDKLLNLTAFYRCRYKDILKGGGCPILNTAVDADDTHPLLKKKVAGSIKALKKTIENIVEQGITSKTIRPSVDPAEFSIVFISLIEGGMMLAKITGNASMLNSSIGRIEHIINSELKM